MLKKIIFSAAIVVISLFLCSAGCGNVAAAGSTPTISIGFPDDFWGDGGSSDGNQQDNSGDGTLNTRLKLVEFENNGMNSPTYDQNNMYIFIHLKGDSHNGSFIYTPQATVSGGTPTTIYSKDVQYQTKDGTETNNYVNFGGSIKYGTYSDTYGYSSTDGKTLDFNFYLGSTKFGIQKNGNRDITFNMRNVVVLDTGIGSGWSGASNSIVRVENTRFTIPMSKFDSTKHKNWACFTVNLSQNPNYTSMAKSSVAVTFDGFAPK